MDYNQAKAVLEKYLDGNSSLQEEEELMLYFSNMQHIPKELQQAKAMFTHFKDSREIRFPEREKNMARFNSMRIPAIAASLAVLLGTSLLIVKLSTGTIHSNLFSNTITVLNDSLAVKKVTLPDNNVVWLNRNSSLTYPKKLDKETNTLSIFGEAYFEPFQDVYPKYLVLAENALIEPETGSSFNIHADPDKESIEISVSSGAIAVSEKRDREGLALLVTAGNYCSIHKYQKLIFSATNKNDNFLSWKTGTLVFKSTHMATVTDALTKYYDVQISFEDKALAYCQFTGEFREKSLSYVLNRIKSELKFDINIAGDFITLSGEGCLPK